MRTVNQYSPSPGTLHRKSDCVGAALAARFHDLPWLMETYSSSSRMLFCREGSTVIGKSSVVLLQNVTPSGVPGDVPVPAASSKQATLHVPVIIRIPLPANLCARTALRQRL